MHKQGIMVYIFGGAVFELGSAKLFFNPSGCANGV